MAFRKVDTVLSGLLILAGLIVLGLAIYLVKGGRDQFQPKVRYSVVFTNGGGLEGGDEVFLDGQKVGEVAYTARVAERRVDVYIEVGKDVAIPVGSTGIVTKSVTGEVAIEIISGDSEQILEVGGQFPGQLPRSFTQIERDVAAIGEDLASIKRKLGRLIENARGAAGDLDTETIGTNWNEATAALGRAGDEWQQLLDEVRGPSEELRGDFDGARTEWRELGQEFGEDGARLRDRYRTVRANLDEASAEASGLGRDLEDLKFGFAEAMDRLDSSAEKFRRVAHAVEEAVVGVKPQVRRFVKDAEDAFARFQSLRSDFLRAPWKLLYKPSADEVATVHWFNAVRLYMEAANEVSRTIDALDALRRKSELGDAEHAAFGELFERLRLALGDFDARQKRVVELLLEGRAAGSR